MVGNLHESPVFDCGETLLSAMVNTTPTSKTYPVARSRYFEVQAEAACDAEGLFKDITVHLGPIPVHTLVSQTEIPPPVFDYNPRCLNRSLNDFLSTRFTSQTQATRLLAATDTADFQMVMDHWPATPDGVLGLHGGGHFSIGSSMQDLFSSPQDPAFMLHDAMIDRL